MDNVQDAIKTLISIVKEGSSFYNLTDENYDELKKKFPEFQKRFNYYIEVLKYLFTVQAVPNIKEYGNLKEISSKKRLSKDMAVYIYETIIDLIKSKPWIFKSEDQLKHFFGINRTFGGFLGKIQRGLRNTKYNDVNIFYKLDDIFAENRKEYRIKLTLNNYLKMKRFEIDNSFKINDLLRIELQKLRNLDKNECEGHNNKHHYSKLLEIHHLDGNHSNNNFNNLKILCPSCHQMCHNHIF